MNGGQIGRSLRRLEDPRFLTGQGRHVDDISPPDQLHAIVLRSPYGHALIDGIDTVAARAMPGVRSVFTAADLAAGGIGALPCIAQVATVAPMIVPRRRALALDRVRHVGDPVAFVVAGTTDQARDAAERIRVAYRPLPAVVGAIAALGPEAPLLWDEALCNGTIPQPGARRSRPKNWPELRFIRRGLLDLARLTLERKAGLFLQFAQLLQPLFRCHQRDPVHPAGGGQVAMIGSLIHSSAGSP
jgi:CO/xanthine dehydrogenase Mo-binding subunit